jgi:hypothetical protein
VAYYQQKSPTNWPGITKSQNIDMLPATIKEQFTQDYIRQEGIFSLLPQERQSELSFAKQGYVEAQKTIDQMIKLGIVIGGPPIKKQTLAEKFESFINSQHKSIQISNFLFLLFFLSIPLIEFLIFNLSLIVCANMGVVVET